jgi:hypothetical protein
MYESQGNESESITAAISDEHLLKSIPVLRAKSRTVYFMRHVERVVAEFSKSCENEVIIHGVKAALCGNANQPQHKFIWAVPSGHWRRDNSNAWRSAVWRYRERSGNEH